jgi:hypothetical protein
MATENTFDASGLPTLYFYVNKSTGEVEYLSMYTIFGNTVRPKGQKWTMGTRDDLAKYYSKDYEIWSFDWETVDDTPGSGTSIDPDDEDEWETELVNDWGAGKDLTREDIKSTFKLVNSGDDYISAEEADNIPGEV